MQVFHLFQVSQPAVRHPGAGDDQALKIGQVLQMGKAGVGDLLIAAQIDER